MKKSGLENTVGCLFLPFLTSAVVMVLFGFRKKIAVDTLLVCDAFFGCPRTEEERYYLLVWIRLEFLEQELFP
jgi:hypothetical protein